MHDEITVDQDHTLFRGQLQKPLGILVEMRLVIGVIAVLSVVMMLGGRHRPATRKSTVPAMVPLSAAVVIGFVLAFQWLGIVPAMVGLCLGLPLLWGERRWQLILPFGLGFPAAVYFLFVEVLEVHFEPSPLAFW
jgi:putative tricarboxylic transport membrane protein